MKVNLQIRQGSTFRFVFRWEKMPLVYKAITAISKSAPVSLTVPSHGLTSGWRAAVSGVLGMTEINAASVPPRESQYLPVTVVDSNTVQFNSISSERFSTYVSGGHLQYYTPADLAGFTARMSVRDRVGGTLLTSLSTGDTRIVIDNNAKTITLLLSAADTEDFTFTRGTYDLELESPLGEVTALAEGSIRVSREITTSA